MKLAEMTYLDVREYLESKSSLIIPVGTTEQHGAHLPLNNDVLVAECLAEELSKRTGMLIAPTISYGVNLPLDSMMYGTAGVQESTLHSYVSELVFSWEKQGFADFYIVNYHGDPFHLRALESVKGVRLLEPYEIDYADILEKQSTIRHACEAETSVALYLYPDKVKMGEIVEFDVEWPGFRPYIFHEIETPPEGYAGCLGFPSAATAEKGKRIYDRMIGEMMRQIGE